MKESESLIDNWVGRVRNFLADFKDARVSSQALQKQIGAEKVAPDTWTAIIRKIFRNDPNKEIHLGEYGTFSWAMEGRSLVRQTAEAFGFADEAV